jgi:hypothetical protein
VLFLEKSESGKKCYDLFVYDVDVHKELLKLDSECHEILK